MPPDSLSRQAPSCRDCDRNWHSNIASANFDPSVGCLRRVTGQKASLWRTSASRSKLFRSEQTRSNPLRLTHSLSSGYLESRRIKPIGAKFHNFKCLGGESAGFWQFLNEVPAKPAINELPDEIRPIKPIEGILFVFMMISQKSQDQTHGVYLKRFQWLTTIFGPYFANFKCACVRPINKRGPKASRPSAASTRQAGLGRNSEPASWWKAK